MTPTSDIQRLSNCPRNSSRDGRRRSPARGAGWLLAACSLLAGLVIPPAASAAPRPNGGTEIRRDATVKAVEKAMASVVNIGTLTVERADPYEQMLREFFGYGRRAPDTLYSSGSGVIIDEEGWVLTNFHVVREAAKVQVTVANAAEAIDADVVSASEANDLALLRLKPKSGQKFKAIAFAGDDDLMLGETVLALGNPYGLGGSVSRGILSSKTRRSGQDGEAMEVEDWLQTDASINPGNSGGPLVNLDGELIGLNVAILARAQGIGFAIPIKRISSALSEMFAPEATRGLWFGATVQGQRPPLVVMEIQRGSPADTAGLEPGDEIVAVDGKTARSAMHFYRALGADDNASKIAVLCGEKRKEMTVRLVAEKTVFNAEFVRRRTGLTLERISRDLALQLRLNSTQGWLVAGVDKNGPADRAGLAKGTLITAVDGVAGGDWVSLGRLLQKKRGGDVVKLDLILTRRRGMIIQIQQAQAELKLR